MNQCSSQGRMGAFNFTQDGVLFYFTAMVEGWNSTDYGQELHF